MLRSRDLRLAILVALTCAIPQTTAPAQDAVSPNRKSIRKGEPSTRRDNVAPIESLKANANAADEDARPEENAPAEQATRKDDRPAFDPDASAALRYQLAPNVFFGAKAGLDIEFENNDDQRDSSDDLRILGKGKLDLAILYQPVRKVDFFLEPRFSHEVPLEDQAGQDTEDTEIEIRRAYVLVRDIAGAKGWDIQVGRQRFADDREWLYDENLDAAVLRYDRKRITFELGVSSILLSPFKVDGLDRHDDNQDFVNVTLNASYRYAKRQRIKAFYIRRDADSDRKGERDYVGLSWRAEPIKRQEFWIDTSGLFGSRERSGGTQDLRAYAIDAGWTSRLKLPWKPSFTLSYAFGSGDSNTNDDHRGAYEQTGLQDNMGKFNGITKFKYYGEALDPELSNLMIYTAGFGVRPSKQFSVDFVYHHYRLVERADTLRNVAVRDQLRDGSKDLGHAVDVILGARLNDRFRASLTLGVLAPGPAFERHDSAIAGELRLQQTF